MNFSIFSLDHTYGFGPEFERVMIYYDKARLDGLARRHETVLELTDFFVNRDDFLEYRKAVFEPRPKKFGPADKDAQRPIIVNFVFSFNHTRELNLFSLVHN